jgi:predicted dithiol-disulfide oxidoreductase (DUF899 family)
VHSFLDGVDGGAPDVSERAAFAVAKVPIDMLRTYARDRRRVNMRLLSSAGTTYNRDYHGEDADGEQRTRMDVFVKSHGQVRHFYATEQVALRPGWNDRHVDLLWPLWDLLDLTPAGRGDDWYPSYSAKRSLSAPTISGNDPD